MAKFFEIKNKTPTSADLYFYGDIVSDTWGKWTDEDKCPQDIIDMLHECGDVEELNIYINSGGGSVWGGVAIYNILRRFNAKKTVHIDGVAASIASVIALSGDKIIMPKNSFLMIHKAMTSAFGNADELRSIAESLETIEKSIINTYMENAIDGIEESFIKEMMSAETWLTAEDAEKLFKNIEVIDSVEAVACISDYRYKKAPGSVFASRRKEKTPSPKPRDDEFRKAENRLRKLKNFIFEEEYKNDNE